VLENLELDMALYRESTVTEKKILHPCLFSSKNNFLKICYLRLFSGFHGRFFLIINYQLSNPRVNILELFMPTFTRNFSQGILTGNFSLQVVFVPF